MNISNKKTIGYIAAVISAVLLGSEGIFVRNITVDEYVIMLARLGLGFVFLVIYLLAKKKLPAFSIKHVSFPLISTGILLALTMLFYMQAINIIPLANAVFLLFLGPIVATALSSLFLRERYTYTSIGLLLLAFLGFMLLLEFKLNIGIQKSIGYFWGLCGGLCYGVYIVINRSISDDIDTMTRSVYQLLLGFLIMLPFVFALENVEITKTDIYWLLGISFFQGFVGITLIIVAIKHLKIVEYATVSYLEPLVASILGYLIYNEYLSSMQILGCVLILTGGIVQIYKSQKNI